MGAKATCWPFGALSPAREASQNHAFPESSGCVISKQVFVGLELDRKTHESGIDFRPNTDSFKHALQTLSWSGGCPLVGTQEGETEDTPHFLCKADLRLDWGKGKSAPVALSLPTQPLCSALSSPPCWSWPCTPLGCKSQVRG